MQAFRKLSIQILKWHCVLVLLIWFIPCTFGSSLVAYYSFNQSSGTSVDDLSGNNNSGTLGNFSDPDAAWENGPAGYGNALHFDGVDDYVTAPDQPFLDITEAITVSAWIKADNSNNGSYKRIVEKRYDTSWYFGTGATSNSLNVHINGINLLDTGTNAFAEGVWTHIAFTYDSHSTSDQIKIYIDGQVYTAGSYTTAIGTDDAVLRIGNWIEYGSYVFPGLIDEVGIWNGALTESELLSVYQYGITGTIIPELKTSFFLMLGIIFGLSKVVIVRE